MFLPLHANQPTGGDLIVFLAPFPGKVETSFFNLSQCEFQLLANRAKPYSQGFHKLSFLAGCCGPIIVANKVAIAYCLVLE
ncbi:MAG: hypothetical protein QOE55_7424 [Acidobacteriaceae bacterium]|nr:hypothetical protein [Acidobacteriaceae bacterium]